MVADILRSEGLSLHPAECFVPTLPRPVRFAAFHSRADRTHPQDPRYRRIACRCEFVTEGEVLDAIAHGASTLDGIKFRTRAGMGRCQGGFCTSRCLELLARRSGAAHDRDHQTRRRLLACAATRPTGQP